MANVIVKLFATLSEKVKKQSIEASGNTVIEVLRNIVKDYPELKNEILNENMELKEDYIYLLNGRNVHFLNGKDTTLKDRDKISIFPPVGGG
ncbi:MAG: MoaD/ThiS family protein [Caldisericaceae bacterium]